MLPSRYLYFQLPMVYMQNPKVVIHLHQNQPQVYLQYVSGLRSQINRLRMRYDITKWLQLQTETGDQQAADLFYIFER